MRELKKEPTNCIKNHLVESKRIILPRPESEETTCLDYLIKNANQNFHDLPDVFTELHDRHEAPVSAPKFQALRVNAKQLEHFFSEVRAFDVYKRRALAANAVGPKFDGFQ